MHHIRMTDKKNHIITVIDVEKGVDNSIATSDFKNSFKKERDCLIVGFLKGWDIHRLCCSNFCSHHQVCQISALSFFSLLIVRKLKQLKNMCHNTSFWLFPSDWIFYF